MCNVAGEGIKEIQDIIGCIGFSTKQKLIKVSGTK